MKRAVACRVLASVVGLALAGCSTAANRPATPSGQTPASSPVTAAQSASSSTSATSQGAAQGGGVATLAMFNQIKPGMTYAAVTKITGSPGKKIGDVTMDGVHVTMYGWYGTDVTHVLVVQFKNGAVSMTSQQGLK